MSILQKPIGSGFNAASTAGDVIKGIDLPGRIAIVKGVRAFSLHPGSIVGTGLDKHLSTEELRAAGVIDENGKPILDPAKNLKTVEQGAATSVWCATSPLLDGMGGVYCENCDIAPLELVDPVTSWKLGDSTRHSGVMPYAVDPEAADRLWTLSEQLLGLKSCE
jgi:hypothetical protein